MNHEERVHRLEDREAIKTLRYEYARHLDDREWERWTELFTPDAKCSFSGLGEFEGREELLSLARETVAQAFEYSAHVMHHPEIQVDANSGHGRWLVQIYFANREDGIGGWRQGRYRDEYRRVGDEWKFAEVSHTFYARSLFEYQSTSDERWGELIEFSNPATRRDT
jgi:hypothetical protein